jgi:hypothetical protein
MCSISTSKGELTFKVGKKQYFIDCDPKGKRITQLKTTEPILFQTPKKQRRADYIFGPSGVGKSTFATERIIIPYKKQFPNNPFYLVSPKDDDETINKQNPNRIAITYDTFVSEERLTLEEIAPCIILFDDTEAISDAGVRKGVDSFRDQCLVRGRSLNISVCTIMHLHSGGFATRTLILESNTITFFPQGGQIKGIHDILKTYAGLDENTIKELLAMKTDGVHTACTYHKTFPNWLSTKSAFYLT